MNKVVEPIEGTKPDGQIIVDIMNRMGYPQPDYTAMGMLEEISQIVPFFAGVKWDELGVNGKQWPVKPDGEDTQMLHIEEFKMAKVNLLSFHLMNPKRLKSIVRIILISLQPIGSWNIITVVR